MPALINNYKTESVLSEGVLATSYRAIDILSDKAVVLKILKPETTSKLAEDLIRYKKVITQVTSFKHPYIASIIEQGSFEDSNYLVMELVEGKSLKELFDANTKFTPKDAAEVAYQVACALEYAHSQNLLHLDLRPSNIIVNLSTLKSKLLDFGLSFLIEYSQLKKESDVVSVFSYISPEQSGIMKRASDERSDLYSLGVIFYQLLTGEAPFKASTVGDLLHQHMAKLPVPLRKLNPEVPEVLEQVVLKLLSKEPESRYQTAKGLVADLEEFKKGSASFVIGRHDRLKKLLFRTRLIGREEELNKLKARFDKTKENLGAVCLVKGEAGRGKSRLVDEMRSYVYEQGGIFLSGRCFSQENKTPYQPFKDILNEFIERVKKQEPPAKENTIKRLQDSMGQLGEIILKVNPGMETIIGKQPALVPLDPEREHRRLLMAASRFFLNFGVKDEPIVLFIDDLQWSDEASLSLFSEIISEIKDSSLLILGTYRDNEIGQTHSLSGIIQEAQAKSYPFEEISPPLFDLKRLNKFLSELLLEDEERLADLSKYILDKCKGNPFFSLEITRQLVQEKALNYDEEKKHWKIDSQKLKQLTISANIVDIVLKRIDILEEDKLNLLSYASVIGRGFELRLLLNLTKLPEEKFISLIDESVSLQLLEKSLEKGKALFVHDRIRDAFYAKITPERLKQINLEIARTLEESHKDNLEPVIFELAHHYTEAEDKDKSLQYALPAARKALKDFANKEAIKYYQYIKTILLEENSKDERYAEVLEGLSDALRLEGLYDKAIENLKECLTLSEDRLIKARLLQKIGDNLFGNGKPYESIEYLHEALKMLGRKPYPKSNAGLYLSIAREALRQTIIRIFPKALINDKRKDDIQYLTALRIYFRLTYCYYFIDMLRSLLSVLTTLNLSEKTGDSDERAWSYIGMSALAGGALGLFNLGEKYLNEGLNISLRTNNRLREGFAYMFGTYLYFAANRLSESIDYGKKGVELLGQLGEKWELGVAYSFTCLSYTFRGEFEENFKCSQEFIRSCEQINDMRALGWALIDKAGTVEVTQDVEAAITILKTALGHQFASKEEVHITWGYSHLISALTRNKNYEEVLKTIEEGLPFARASLRKLTMASWAVDFFGYCADAYMTVLKEAPQLLTREKTKTLKRIRELCKHSFFWSKRYQAHLGLAFRVNAKFQWNFGSKKKALKYFGKGIEFTQRHRHEYQLGLLYFELGKLLSQEDSTSRFYDPKKAEESLQVAKEIFSRLGAKFDLEEVNKILNVGSQEPKSLSAQERLAVERRLSTLITVSHHLSSILDLEELLSKIVSSAIEVAGAERGFLFLYSSDKKALEVRIAQGTETGLEITPLLDYKRYKLCSAIIKEVQAKTTPLLFNPQVLPSLTQDEDIKAFQIKSVICTPLKVREEVLGLLYLDNRLTENAFDEQDADLIDSLAIQAGISLQNAFLVKEIVEKERLEEELRLGREIQTALLPKELPNIPNLTISGIMLPAKEIGGDYYDFITLPKEEALAIVIGDVSGKGVAAGLLMAMAKTAIHTLSQENTSPRDVLLRTNSILYSHIGGQKFMTMLYLIYKPKEKSLRYSSAGHEHILVYRKNKDAVESIISGGFMLGMMDDITSYLEDKTIILEPQDKVLLYTDGVTEAESPSNERFGLDRLISSFKDYSQKNSIELLKTIKDQVYEFMDTQPQYDDITLVVMEVK